ncbi:cytochrome c biogenesis CcdA family protein [Nakamurella aerolata]|uniref:Cytochrome c biogenesis protein CcdA n=1 Tax=Nakamurella aerolata TaxID=1656892 RepID=A0A849A8S0_9ACTN|nr:cytochrome c biogenesis CcdA family protein [Nakamurella aerolata]NNG35471.1 cytochrome c biogenesis protein CcdA [Nakamurella aerolata]
MTPQIGVAGAFLGGLLALISPCAALLLPSFLSYAFTRTGTLVARTAVFYLGMALVLVPLGAGVGAVGAALTRYRTTVTTIGGFVIIALGVATMLGWGFRLDAAGRWLGRLRLGSSLSVLALGALYGLAGFCSGPLIGSVLTIAATGADPGYGGLLMAVYALGMTVPLLTLALLWDRLQLRERKWLRGRQLRLGPITTHTTSLISGLLFVGIGTLFVLTDGTANLGGFSSVDTQFQWQAVVQRVSRGLSDALVWWIVAALVLAGLLIRVLVISRRGRRSVSAPEAEPEAESEGEKAPVPTDPGSIARP